MNRRLKQTGAKWNVAHVGPLGELAALIDTSDWNALWVAARIACQILSAKIYRGTFIEPDAIKPHDELNESSPTEKQESVDGSRVDQPSVGGTPKVEINRHFAEVVAELGEHAERFADVRKCLGM